MSWSLDMMGKPSKVVEALEALSTTLTGQSKEEYDEVLPSMVTLVKANVENASSIIHITASGHAHIVDGNKLAGTCSVNIQNIWTALV